MTTLINDPYIFFMGGMLCLGFGLVLNVPDDCMMPADDDSEGPPRA
jgi:hypothetical protein